MRSGVIRGARAWRSLTHEHRRAVMAAAALFLTLFFPWYQETVVSARHAASASVSGWGAFSFVEFVVLVVAAGVLVLLFRRGEGHGAASPARDGITIAVAGTFTGALVIWRIFDRQTVHVTGPGAAISGVEWGIFLALAASAFLAYAGNRIRLSAARVDEQPTGSFEPVSAPPRQAPARRARRRRYVAADQLTIPLEEREPAD